MSNWTTNDIPDQAGRTILITGANSGIGYEAAKALVDTEAHVVLACLSLAKAAGAVAQLVAGSPSCRSEPLVTISAVPACVPQAAGPFLVHPSPVAGPAN